MAKRQVTVEAESGKASETEMVASLIEARKWRMGKSIGDIMASKQATAENGRVGDIDLDALLVQRQQQRIQAFIDGYNALRQDSGIEVRGGWRPVGGADGTIKIDVSEALVDVKSGQVIGTLK